MLRDWGDSLSITKMSETELVITDPTPTFYIAIFIITCRQNTKSCGPNQWMQIKQQLLSLTNTKEELVVLIIPQEAKRYSLDTPYILSSYSLATPCK